MIVGTHGVDPLVDVGWIAEHLADPRVRLVEVDVSRAVYDEGHIPGAVLWDAYKDLRGRSYRPVVKGELARLLSRTDVTPDTTVVCYGYGASLGFWLLKSHGHEDVRMLMGSRGQWEQTGHGWSTDVPEPAEAALAEPIENADMLASRQDVESAIADSAHVLLDVRLRAEYTGERFWPSGATEDAGRAGHISGAVSLPIDTLQTEDEVLKNADELRCIFEQAGVTADKSVIAYCTIGNRAAQAWLR
jgi:thiosulfate/3-mercaptopyruvate sulfurtransferase